MSQHGSATVGTSSAAAAFLEFLVLVMLTSTI